MLVNYTRKYEKVSILASALMLIVALFLIFKACRVFIIMNNFIWSYNYD